MAKLANVPPRVIVEATLMLNEGEMRALDALFGYGIDSLLKVFYQHLGTHYMKPHEAGLRSLCVAVQNDIPPILRRASAARGAFNHNGETN